MKTFKQLIKESEDYLGTDNSLHGHEPGLNGYGKHQKLLKDATENLHKYEGIEPHEAVSLHGYIHGNALPELKYHQNQQWAGYELINNHNRHSNLHGETKEIVENHIKNIDSAIAKHTTDHHIHVWRGIGDNILHNVKKGDIVHDKGFVSTSVDPDHARSFGNTGVGVYAHINIPKGSKALSVNKYPKVRNHNDDRGISAPNENEVILPRGSKFRYEGKSLQGGKEVHHLTHIPGE